MVFCRFFGVAVGFFGGCGGFFGVAARVARRISSRQSRCLDNIWIERFWRTVKREYICLKPKDNVAALRRGIVGFVNYYNNRRSHQRIGHKIQTHVYAMAA